MVSGPHTQLALPILPPGFTAAGTACPPRHGIFAGVPPMPSPAPAPVARPEGHVPPLGMETATQHAPMIPAASFTAGAPSVIARHGPWHLVANMPSPQLAGPGVSILGSSGSAHVARPSWPQLPFPPTLPAALDVYAAPDVRIRWRARGHHVRRRDRGRAELLTRAFGLYAPPPVRDADASLHEAAGHLCDLIWDGSLVPVPASALAAMSACHAADEAELRRVTSERDAAVTAARASQCAAPGPQGALLGGVGAEQAMSARKRTREEETQTAGSKHRSFSLLGSRTQRSVLKQAQPLLQELQDLTGDDLASFLGRLVSSGRASKLFPEGTREMARRFAEKIEPGSALAKALRVKFGRKAAAESGALAASRPRRACEQGGPTAVGRAAARRSASVAAAGTDARGRGARSPDGGPEKTIPSPDHAADVTTCEQDDDSDDEEESDDEESDEEEDEDAGDDCP